MNATPPERTAIAVEPDSRRVQYQSFCRAVERAGGTVVPTAEASALIWANPFVPEEFPSVLGQGPQLEWVQLPFAGSGPFLPYVDEDRIWTCGKGAYADPVAEHALGMALAGFRNLVRYAKERSWTSQRGRNLQGANVTILGGGGIASAFLDLLEPFGCSTTVVRRKDRPLAKATRTITQARLYEVLPRTDLLLIAWALTPDTAGVVNADVFATLPDHAWIVNVGRGGHIVTDDLVAALNANAIGGAALDVTDPEPLPDGHPLWGFDNVLITPHTANTLEMGLPLITQRVEDNVRRWIAGKPLLGILDPIAGY